MVHEDTNHCIELGFPEKLLHFLSGFRFKNTIQKIESSLRFYVTKMQLVLLPIRQVYATFFFCCVLLLLFKTGPDQVVITGQLPVHQ